MVSAKHVTRAVQIGVLLAGACLAALSINARREQVAVAAAGERYVVLAWNDLGMHCYNRDFRDLAVLPPYNTLWAQVLRRQRGEVAWFANHPEDPSAN